MFTQRLRHSMEVGGISFIVANWEGVSAEKLWVGCYFTGFVVCEWEVFVCVVASILDFEQLFE